MTDMQEWDDLMTEFDAMSAEFDTFMTQSAREMKKHDSAPERASARSFKAEKKEKAEDDTFSGRPDYISIGNALAGGRISNIAVQKMMLYKSSENEADPGMKQFYPAFTVLQGAPSGKILQEAISGLDTVPQGQRVYEGLQILKSAIKDEMQKQKQKNDLQDKAYWDRRFDLSEKAEKKEKEYQRAVRKTKRWR